MSENKALVPSVDIALVSKFHKDPIELARIICLPFSDLVFDVTTNKGRTECRSLSANLIKCIKVANDESIRLAEDAKKVVKQDIDFRKQFEKCIREAAEYHRQPLTEWEAEQERIEAEQKAEVARIEAERQASIAAEALKKEIENCHEIGLLLNEKFDRDRAEDLRIAEQKRIERDALIAREAEEKARREIEAEKEAALRREIEAKLAKEKAELELKLAQERAALAEREATIKAAEAAENARKAEIARQEAIAKAEADAKAEREANQRHIRSIDDSAINAIVDAVGIDLQEAEQIIMAIKTGQIPYVTINY